MPVGEVLLELAPELFGGDPAGLLKFLGLDGKKVGDRWSVKTAEGAAGIEPNLVSVTSLHDPDPAKAGYDKLRTIAGDDVRLDTAGQTELDKLRERLETRVKSPGDIAAALHSFRVEPLFAPKAHLPALVRQIDDAIGAVKASDGEGQAFPDHSSHLVTVSETLLHRVRLPSVLFRIDQDPASLKNLAGALQKSQSGELFAASSSGMFTSVVAMSMYLGPLMGCLTPRFWCFNANRPLTIILFSLGTDINGLRYDPMEPLQLLPYGNTMTNPSSKMKPTRPDYIEAINWWVAQLNRMFFFLTDPVTFADSNGVYDPHEHQHWMLTFDRLFRLMTSLMGAARDTASQQQLMNTLLDLFEGRILGTDFQTLCTLRYAKKIRDKVKDSLPPSVRPLLLPAADRALTALEDVQKGFFIKRQRADEMVKLRLLSGAEIEKSPERATAIYLDILRNSTHGFGPKKGSQEKIETETSLLIHHDGNLPDDVALLPYLYLLYMLCNPDLIRDRIVRGVSGG